MIREFIEQIISDIEGRIDATDIEVSVSPLDRLKTISRLIANKASMVPSEYSSLDVCTKYDKSKREGQLEDFKGVIRDILFLSLEASMNAHRLEADFGRGRA